MDRRLFVTGLVGVGATTAVALVLPRQAQALVTVPPRDLPPLSDGLPDLTAPEADSIAPESDWKDYVELVYHRRRRRVRRWRRRCRRHWWYGHWRRRCRRVPFWVWISIGI
ncbi:MAG: protamine-2 (modular protein) [Aestuariivirgaceae bacterium]